MFSGHKARIPLCFSAALALLGFAGTVNAAGIRYAQVTGTSTGVGTITVETFSKPDFPGRLNPKSPAACSPCSIHVTVPSGRTNLQTAQMLADSASAQLPGDYTAGIVGGFPNTVAICYNGIGPLTSINIIETIPGQTVVEVPGTSVPTLTEWGLILLAVLVSGLSIFVMRRRFRPGRMTT